MVFASRVKRNISYASIASGKIKIESLRPTPPPLLVKNYTFLSPYQQRFPLPYDMIKYILNNPLSAYQLLIIYQTCKYFYYKKQVLIVSGKIHYRRNGAITCKYLNKTNFKNIKKPNLWFIGELLFCKKVSFDLTKIYRSTIKCLFLDKPITLNEFKLLVAEGTVEFFTICKFGSINDSDNQVAATLDVILSLLPNIKKLWYCYENEIFSNETFKKMNAIKLNNKFEQFLIYLNDSPIDLDAELLFEFVFKNAGPFCEIFLIVEGENAEINLLKLTVTEEKFKSLKEWNDKKFRMKYTLLE